MNLKDGVKWEAIASVLENEAPAEDNTSTVIWGHSAQAGFLGDMELAVADCSRDTVG